MSFVSKNVCEIVIKWMLNKLNSVLNNFPSKNNEWKNALSKKKKKKNDSDKRVLHLTEW